MNHAYVVLLCSQFQSFCRNLHTECAKILTESGLSRDLRLALLEARVTEGRKLDAGNPNPGNLGSDFRRLGIDFWVAVRADDAGNAGRHRRLEQMCLWRNAIAHQDFDNLPGHIRTIRLVQIRRWRRTCDQLAISFDRVMGRYLSAIMGKSPW